MNKSEKIDEHNKSANSWANHDQTMIKPCAQVTSTSWKSQEHVMQNYEQVMNMTWTSREKRMDNRWTMSVHDIKTLRFFLCHHCFSWKVIQSGQKPRGHLTAILKPPGSHFWFSAGILGQQKLTRDPFGYLALGDSHFEYCRRSDVVGLERVPPSLPRWYRVQIFRGTKEPSS